MEKIDQADWERKWASMEIRRLTDLQHVVSLSLFRTDFGLPLSATISDVPAQFLERMYFPIDGCPICGKSTVGTDRSAAYLSVRFETIKNLGVGVWTHPKCFEMLQVSDEPSPIPW